MARSQDDALQPTYAAARAFVDRALTTDDSLFTPGKPIWGLENLAQLVTHFVGAPDDGTGSFEEKFQSQLANVSDDALQLAAECLFVYSLADSGMTGGSKRQAVNQVLGWRSGPAVTIPADLSAALDRGFGAAGTYATTSKPHQISYLVRFADRWKRMASVDRAAALADPWRMKAFAVSVDAAVGLTYMRQSTLYLTHADSFERIFSDSHRRRILAALGGLAPGITDADRHLLAVRRALEERYGEIDFYSTNAVLALWNPSYAPWRVFAYWCGRALSIAEFREWEIDYKLEIAARVRAARDALVGGDPSWPQALRECLRRNNLINYRPADDVAQWAEADPEAASDALRTLWSQGPDVLDRVAGFFERFPRAAISGPGGRAQLVSILLMGEDPNRYPPFKPTEYQQAWTITGFAPEQATDSAVYARALDFLDQIIERAREQGITIPDRLHAQSAMWTVLTYDKTPAGWTDDEWAGLQALRSLGPPLPPGTEDDQDEVIDEHPSAHAEPIDPYDVLASLADELAIEESDLRRIVEVLEDKRQVIFYGPPGTGKTFVAQRLAQAIAGGKDGVRLVQFHPSYSYEDFVEGYRPRVLDSGQPGFELVPGPLRRIAAQAATEPDRLWFLIIDEINRGNIAKVLGELYFLLEYRDETADLLYSATPFHVPKNLRIIGTMNTADRSIALMDAALRRRFGFVPFFPDKPPVLGLLRRRLTGSSSPVPWIADVLDKLNEKLDDRNSAIGPSYFLRGGLDEATVERIWEHEILPQLEELYFDRPERIAEMSLGALRAAVTKPSDADASNLPADAPAQPG